MKWICLFLIIVLGVSEGIAAERMTCEQAMNRLMEGNNRYVHDELAHPDRDLDRREAVVSSQSPFAVIVGCSDSRVSPEIVFDQGIGDLFVVRVAGNVIGDLELNSIDYGVLYLGAVCIIVMGHENCGAVKAVIDGNTKNVEAIAKLIKPAVQEAKEASPKDLLTASIKENAHRMKDFLLDSKIIKDLVKQNKVCVRAAYYNLNTGSVEWLK